MRQGLYGGPVAFRDVLTPYLNFYF